VTRRVERAIADRPVVVLRPMSQPISQSSRNVVRSPSFSQAQEEHGATEVDSEAEVHDVIQQLDATALSVSRFGLHHCNVRWLHELFSIPLASWPQATQLWDALGTLLAAATPLATGGLMGTALSGGVSMGICPLPVFPTPSSCCLSNLGLGVLPPLQALSLKDLQKGIVVATFVQGSMGVVRIMLGDVFSGCYTLLLATLGFNARRPGPASNWLKTYVLLTFINGTMSGIDLLQSKLLQTFPLVQLATLPLSVNMLHTVQLMVPAVSFFGAYCGWQHIKMQRRIQREAYQQRLLLLMENTPWPPPPLPFALPGCSPNMPQALPGFPAPMAAANR